LNTTDFSLRPGATSPDCPGKSCTGSSVKSFADGSTRLIRSRNASDRAETRETRTWWFSWPVLLGLLVFPLIMAFKLQGDLWPATLAYANCVIGFTAVVLCARKARVESFIPVFFLPLLIVAWPLASIYFSMFYPDMSYGLLEGSVRMLEGNEKIQLAVLLFLCGYLPIVFFALRKAARSPRGCAARPGTVGDVVAILAVVVLTVNAISRVLPLPPPLVYVVDGLLIYSQGLLFLPGAVITRVSNTTKRILAIFLPLMVVFYTLGNARGIAMIPCAMFLSGILFFSDVKSLTKFGLLGAIVIILPTYMIIGNTTRELTHSIGFRDLDKRWEALKRWEEVAEKRPAGVALFGRLFFSGGHSIITRTPEERPFLPFHMGEYGKELLASLIPGRLYYEPVYRGNRILSEYGFLITEKTNVEVSMLGNLWLLGGNMFVFLGGLAAGGLHWLLMGCIRLSRGLNGTLGLLFLGVVGTTLVGAAGQDIISQWRSIIWHLIFASLFYSVIAVLTRQWGPQSVREPVIG